MDSLGKRIRQVRKKLGLSQREFAKKVGIGFTTLVRYEKNERSPEASVILKISQIGNISSDQLLTGKGYFTSHQADLMKEVIESVERIFKKEDLSLPPKKKADLIILLYEELLEDESKRKDLGGKIAKLARLAA